MKKRKKKKFLSVFTLFILFMLLISPMTVFAEDSSDIGIVPTISTDKENYSKTDTIEARFTLKSLGAMEIKDLDVNFTSLDGYSLSIKKGNNKIKAGEDTEYIATYTPNKKAPVSKDSSSSTQKGDKSTNTSISKKATKNADSAKTGDNNRVSTYIIVGIASLTIVAFVIRSKKKKNILSFLLIISMTATCIPAFTLNTNAVEEHTISKTIRIGSDEAELQIKYRYTAQKVNSPKDITVNFESNGGSVVAPQSIKYGDLLVTPSIPTKDGYVFFGWYLDKACKYVYNFKDYVPQQDGTLYAKWIRLEDNTDTDGDGVADSFEEIFGTNINKTDTDGDGLPDTYELEPLGLDPTNPDTDKNGIKDGDEDADNDGLTNLEEYQLGTKPGYADSDNDGLTDYEEVKQYHTDPLNKDTDGDGASDGREISIGTDPLIANESFPSTATCDGNHDITGVSVTTELAGNQVGTLAINQNESDFFPDKMPGYVGNAYDFSVNGEISSATLQFSFDKSLLDDPDFVPSVYYMNADTAQLEPLDTEVDKENGTATAKTTHFSTYILLNKTAFDTTWREDIRKPSDSADNGLSVAFVLDRSGSMMFNDPSGLRLSLTKQFIQKMTSGRDYGSLATFVSIGELVTPLTDNLSQLLSDADKIHNDDGFTTISGTNGTAGMHIGIQQLESDTSNNNRVMLFMTDGIDQQYDYQYEDLVTEAKENNITIYTIGLGEVNSTILEMVANETGGKYYYAEAAEDLITIFKDAENETIDYTTDSNDDGISDYYTKILCEGDVYINGIYNPFSGLKYEAVQANSDYDNDGLINGDEFKVANENESSVTFKISSDPTDEDSDNDGLLDGRSQYTSDGIEIAPTDPKPMAYSGERNAWKQHVMIQQNAGNSVSDEYKPIATEYSDMFSLKGELPGQYESAYSFIEIAAAKLNDWADNVDYRENALPVIKFIVMTIKYCTTVYPLQVGEMIDHATKDMPEELKKSILGDMAYDFLKNDYGEVKLKDSIAYVQAILGGVFLNFIPDDKNVALHSQPQTWQRAFGYNDFYDLVFESGSNTDLSYFDDINNEYRIWMWKGDYWNLRSGAEIGLYIRDEKSNGYSSTPIFDAISFEVPMYITLYNCDTTNTYQNILNWNPSINQWWVTGFNWRFQSPIPQNMRVVGKIDLSVNENIYKSFSKSIANDIFIFDDSNSTIWISW